ncbi:MAG: hypothetical protein FJZ59_06770 [Chlamydiae bacterium]|jgi:hypothetical protein|nr:hypothetical protein [Chlamydiota bacterium]
MDPTSNPFPSSWLVNDYDILFSEPMSYDKAMFLQNSLNETLKNSLFEVIYTPDATSESYVVGTKLTNLKSRIRDVLTEDPTCCEKMKAIFARAQTESVVEATSSSIVIPNDVFPPSWKFEAEYTISSPALDLVEAENLANFLNRQTNSDIFVLIPISRRGKYKVALTQEELKQVAKENRDSFKKIREALSKEIPSTSPQFAQEVIINEDVWAEFQAMSEAIATTKIPDRDKRVFIAENLAKICDFLSGKSPPFSNPYGSSSRVTIKRPISISTNYIITYKPCGRTFFRTQTQVEITLEKLYLLALITPR